MASWIGLVVIAQVVNAAIVLIDKYVLNSARGVGRPSVYAFYVSILSGVVLVMVPFGAVSWPSAEVVQLSLIAALSYIFSIFFLYSSLKTMDASDSVPVIGAVSAISAFLLARAWLHQDLPENFTLAFALLTAGTLLISHFRFNTKSFASVLLSGALFGFSAFLMKLIFLETSFADGFFWSRMANVFAALLLLFVPSIFRSVASGLRLSSAGVKWLVLGNKALSGLVFLLIMIAINLGSVSIVNALSGLQFVFLLSFAYFCVNKFPEIFAGEIHPHKIHHKLYGIIFIIYGLLALFLN